MLKRSLRNPLRLSLVAGARRPDLALRRETKYVFPDVDPAILRAILLAKCRPIRHAGPVSTVYSLYFDDPGLGACRANLDGIGLRHKMRLRWYDTWEPTSFFVEKKWRRHRYSGKERQQVRIGTEEDTARNAGLFSTSLADLHGSLCALLSDAPWGSLVEATEPVVLVRYQRRHFALDGTPVRLTLDSNISYFGQLGRRRLSRLDRESLDGLALIECKVPGGDQDGEFARDLDALLAAVPARPARFSKYAIGCRQLGYVCS